MGKQDLMVFMEFSVTLLFISGKISFEPLLPTAKKELLKRSFMANYVKVLITYETVSAEHGYHFLKSCVYRATDWI